MLLMKRSLFSICLVLASQVSFAQTAADTISSADMPVSGDTLRHSAASPLDPTATGLMAMVGASQTWDFSYLVATSQSIDTYQTAMQVNPIFAFTAPAGAYGYKVLDSIAIPIQALPITLKGIYTFFKTNTTTNSFD